MVLLKQVDERGFVFYHQLQQPQGARAGCEPVGGTRFLLAALERQVRVEGEVERVSAAESDEYFKLVRAKARLARSLRRKAK